MPTVTEVHSAIKCANYYQVLSEPDDAIPKQIHVYMLDGSMETTILTDDLQHLTLAKLGERHVPGQKSSFFMDNNENALPQDMLLSNFHDGVKLFMKVKRLEKVVLYKEHDILDQKSCVEMNVLNPTLSMFGGETIYEMDSQSSISVHKTAKRVTRRNVNWLEWLFSLVYPFENTGDYKAYVWYNQDLDSWCLSFDITKIGLEWMCQTVGACRDIQEATSWETSDTFRKATMGREFRILDYKFTILRETDNKYVNTWNQYLTYLGFFI